VQVVETDIPAEVTVLLLSEHLPPLMVIVVVMSGEPVDDVTHLHSLSFMQLLNPKSATTPRIKDNFFINWLVLLVPTELGRRLSPINTR
jgi:hypothetical protein